MELVKRRKFRLEFDIGGTFIDFPLVDEWTGQTYLGKCLTTPENAAIGVMRGMGPVLEDAGISGGYIDIAIHGTTLITNPLIERSGARTAFPTTEGFRDVPAAGTEVRYDTCDLFLQRSEPLVRRNLSYEVRERVDYRGTVGDRSGTLCRRPRRCGSDSGPGKARREPCGVGIFDRHETQGTIPRGIDGSTVPRSACSGVLCE